MAFLETPRFPDGIGAGSQGGKGFTVAITKYGQDRELRTALSSLPRRKFNAANGVQTIQELELIDAFFMAVGGEQDGFRYKDWLDYKSCSVLATPAATDQAIGTGNASTVTFQLVKSYTVGARTRSLKILKPVPGTVLVALNGTPQLTGWTVDTTTGLVTFTSAPGAGVVVSAGYEYDIPVRFDIEALDISLQTFSIGGLNIPLIELRDAA